MTVFPRWEDFWGYIDPNDIKKFDTNPRLRTPNYVIMREREREEI